MSASWPIKSGHPCIGCSEKDFWDRFTPFYERLPQVAGFGVEARADKIGASLVGLTGAGIAAHATYTYFLKRGQEKGEKLAEQEETNIDKDK
jgi:hydrogenase small subunit